jgi:hypothetical protein
MAKQVEVTQFSTITYRNTFATLPEDMKAKLVGKAMIAFDEIVLNKDSKLNKELGGLGNVRTVRVMQDPEAKGEDKPFELLFALKTPENVLKAEAEKKAADERRKKAQEEKSKQVQHGCPSHPEYKAKFPPKVDCAKCKAMYNRRQGFAKKKALTKTRPNQFRKNQKPKTPPLL